MTTETTPGTATPERIAQSEENSYVAVTGTRTFKDEPLQRLATQGKLDVNPDINRRLFQAGERYWENYYLANMSPLAAFDPTRVFSGGSGGFTLSERQAIAREAHRGATAVVPARIMKVVDRIILEFQGDFVAIGREACGLASPDVCRQVAMERLIAGLWVLAVHYGMLKAQ